MLFYIGSGVLLFLGILCWLGTRKAYENGEILPLHVSVAIWVLSIVHFLLVALSSFYAVWQLPFNALGALIAGLVMAGVGLVMLLAGMTEFHSLRRLSGRDISRLITTGMYRWSRNPQYTGWFICLLGISLAGRSGLGFLLMTIPFIVAHLYVVWLEEPYLERVFGDEYRIYKSRTARYIGMVKRKKMTAAISLQ